jgi:signal transduction histidine kinase
LISLSCNKKDANQHYEKLVPEKTDATFSWLMEPRNEEKPNYMGVFYKYYNQLIKENKLENASSILNIVCLKKCRKYSFEPDFVSTVTTFSIKYRIKLPVNKTLYLNSFFTDLYKDKGDYKTAISYALKTTKVEVTNYTTCLEKAKAYSDLAFCYFSVGNQNAAISYNIKALELNNKIDNFSGIGRGYNTLATIYFSSNDFTQAIIYYDKAIKYLKKVNDLENVFIILENKIIAYEESENPNINTLVDSVYTAFNKSKIPSDDVRIFVYSCYITKLIRENKLKEAKKTIDYLAPIVKRTNRIVTDVEFDEVVLDYKIKNNEKIDIEKLLTDIIPHLIENEDYNRLKTYYHILKENAIKNKDYKGALFYEEKANQARTMFSNNRNSNKVIDLDKKYQNQKKENQIAIQEKEIAIKNAAIACLGLLILVVFIIIFIYQNRQKQNKLKQNNLSAQRYTKQLLKKIEEERQRIARDLHDSVSHELLELKNVADGKQVETNLKVDSIINNIRSISRNLHPIMFDKIGLKASVVQMIERAQSVNDFMVTSEIDYNGCLSNSDELQVYRIIQEALSNVIKYSDAIAAKITILEKDKTVSIAIQDNGKGFNYNEVINSSKSFGLHNIIKRSSAIGGVAKITSSKNGTKVTIEIKKK